MLKKHRQAPVFYIDSFESFLGLSNLISQQWTKIWYRGHSDGSFMLEPGFIRNLENLRAEKFLSREFIRRGSAYFSELQKDNYPRWLFMMQHYGLPTRLLDWTESLSVALFFAFEVVKANPPCIYFLNPIELNRIAVNESAIPHETADLAVHYCRQAFSFEDDETVSELPMGLVPHYFDQRLIAQRACFTVHGSSPLPLDYLLYSSKLDANKILIKAQFNQESIGAIRKQISTLLPGASQIYPDIGGLVSELKLSIF